MLQYQTELLVICLNLSLPQMEDQRDSKVNEDANNWVTSRLLVQLPQSTFLPFGSSIYPCIL